MTTLQLQRKINFLDIFSWASDWDMVLRWNQLPLLTNFGTAGTGMVHPSWHILYLSATFNATKPFWLTRLMLGDQDKKPMPYISWLVMECGFSLPYFIFVYTVVGKGLLKTFTQTNFLTGAQAILIWLVSDLSSGSFFFLFLRSFPIPSTHMYKLCLFLLMITIFVTSYKDYCNVHYVGLPLMTI